MPAHPAARPRRSPRTVPFVPDDCGAGRLRASPQQGGHRLGQQQFARIGEEIDKRVDARLRTMNQQAPAAPPAAPPATQARGSGSGLPIAVVSLIFGTGATSIVLSNAANNAIAQTLMVLLIWAAIAVINVANARRR